MIYYYFLFVFFLTTQYINAQNIPEEEINFAFQNAKKGIYWALDNIPDKKEKLKNDLIDQNKLYASVYLVKEINGIKITSRGFNNSTEVVIKMYKSLMDKDELKLNQTVKNNNELPSKDSILKKAKELKKEKR